MSRTKALDEIDTRSGSPDRFGYEWGHYREVLPEHEAQFRGWTAHLTKKDWAGKSFLDVGCGMGRNSYWPLRYGAQFGISIDIDDSSLDAASETLSGFENSTVRKMSAYAIEYRDAFDLVFSIGVIHHLEFPDKALKQMLLAAKPGGRVLIWVYGIENNRLLVSLLSPARNLLFSRLPISVVHHLSLYPAVLLWICLRLGFGRIEYFRQLRRFRFRPLRAIVFDQMLPKIANYWPRAVVERLMHDAGLENVQLAWVNELSWSAIGTKPSGQKPSDESPAIMPPNR